MNEKVYRNPSLAADAVVIRTDNRYPEILLIERKNAPHGWALPGGFVDYGEATDKAAIRELEEETGLVAEEAELLCVASKPDRDPRQHVVSIVYLMLGIEGQAVAADDAKNVGWFDLRQLPVMAFDHEEIIRNEVGRLVGRWI
jgi:8-oxo-dGTP diphosphatase